VEAASGGTLFLDEVGDIPLLLQVKLLRLLENGSYRRVGSTGLRHADVRVVAATHRDLDTMIAEGRFREDLFYRLATFPIPVPPLRERRDDIPRLAVSLLARVAPARRMTLAPAALRRLAAHSYPGNVRELRNVLERAALLADGTELGLEAVERALAVDARRVPHGAATAAAPTPSPPASRAAPPAGLLRDAEREAEHAALRAALAAHRGSRDELARSLGISPRTLYRKLRERAAAQ
jgi:DNA-binding NtrC family response regulator